MSMQVSDYIDLYKDGGYIREMRKYIGHAPLQVVACGVIIENKSGEILLQKRRDNGAWAIIGGAMEIGETFEDTAKREALEEAGIEIEDLNIFKLYSGADCFITYPNGDVCYGPGVVFIAKSYRGEIQNNTEEAIEHRFFKASEIPQEINAPDRKVIEDWKRNAERHNSGGTDATK